jgi:xanthine/uracil/vitamin C permease (AzgA family)
MTKLVSLLIQLGVNRDLITATAVIAGLGSFMFGFLTNLPVALAYVFSSYDPSL